MFLLSLYLKCTCVALRTTLYWITNPGHHCKVVFMQSLPFKKVCNDRDSLLKRKATVFTVLVRLQRRECKLCFRSEVKVSYKSYMKLVTSGTNIDAVERS